MHENASKESVEEALVLAECGYARADSTGYRKAMKTLKERKYVTKAKGKLSLTDKGKEYMAKNSKGMSSKPRNNKGMEEFFKEKILKNTKVPSAKLDLIWGLLADRKEEGASVKDLLKASGYDVLILLDTVRL